MSDYSVVIVGFGPVGAVAACLLGQAGIKTLVIERSLHIYEKPRAVALDHEIARILQGIGLSEALASCTEPFTDSVFYGADGRIIKRMTMLPEPHPQSWTPSMVFLQPTLEAAMRAKAASFPSVTLRLGEVAHSIRQSEAAVDLDITSDKGAYTVQAQYMIACDGASSTCRKQLDMPLEDLGFDEPWLVVDIEANSQGLAKLPQTSVQYCDPQRPTTFVICTGNHRRWELKLREGEDPVEMEKPEAVWRLLSRWITPEDGRLWRSASYRFHALVAKDWRKGRVFLAGDAAHQQPPFLGQGLCQGLRDVANLSWKLIRCIQGQSKDALLNSYGPERGGHVRKLTTTIKSIGRLIGEQDAQRARERDDRLIAEAGGTVKPTPRQDLMPALDTGCISGLVHPARGTLFPQPWINTPTGAKRLDDVTGGGLRLVSAPSAISPDATGLQQVSEMGGRVITIRSATQPEDGVSLVERNTVLADWFSRHAVAYALVRPDHIVFGVASTLLELSALLAEARAAFGGKA